MVLSPALSGMMRMVMVQLPIKPPASKAAETNAKKIAALDKRVSTAEARFAVTPAWDSTSKTDACISLCGKTVQVKVKSGASITLAETPFPEGVKSIELAILGRY